MTALAATRGTHLILNRDVLVSVLVALALTGGSYILALALGWATSVNGLEAFAVLTSYACTYLCVRQRRFNYVLGVVSTAAYSVLFWQSGLLASMALNLYLIPTLVYGWFRWGEDARTRPVTRVEPKWAIGYAVLTLVAFGGALALTTALGGAFAVTDSVILVGSILAQFLLDNKKIETWAVWIVVDVIAVWQYFTAGLPVAGVQYVLFLANAVWAFGLWRTSMSLGRPL
jgi:nicotinamide mononucleotide transporter